MDFPSGGLLKLETSRGQLFAGWDRPELEITTVKTTKASYDSKSREAGRREREPVGITAARHWRRTRHDHRLPRGTDF
jgi:hypothetical protein